MSEEGKSESERIFEALRESPVEPPAEWIEGGVALSDLTFLTQLLKNHKALGYYEFKACVGFSELTNEQNQEAFDRLLANEILNAAIDLAREVARARKLLAESELASKS